MHEMLIHLLRQYKHIPDDDAAVIVQHLAIKTVPEGQYLLREGEIAREMFFICKGILKIVAINDKGEELTYFFLKENQFCTILQSFNNKLPAGEGIKTACETTLIVLPREELLAIYEKLPYLKEVIAQVTQATLLAKIQTRNNYLGLDATTRYKQFIELQPEIALRVSLQDVASYLGITPQSLSRIRRSVAE